MPSVLGNLIVIAILVAAVSLAARSIWKNHKKGGGCPCGGDCSRCTGGCRR